MKNNVFIHLIIVWLLSGFISNLSYADDGLPYNEDVMMNNIIYQKDDSGNTLEEQVSSDKYGNAEGTEFDLAKDGAFKGYTIAVLHLYTGGNEPLRSRHNFDFHLPKAALEEKGFSIVRWADIPPNPKVLENALKKACQLWIISDQVRKLNHAHLKVIKAFFDSGKGVYIWGDNQPYYADANYVAKALLGVTMHGNTHGDKTVGLQTSTSRKGLLPKHMLTTGMEYIYEGITIATIQSNNNHLKSLIYGSAGNLVAAIYDKEGKRAILDGGFTRLFIKWDTAGTGRYVKNAAAWLVNYERFGKSSSNTLASKSMVVDGITVKGSCS